MIRLQTTACALIAVVSSACALTSRSDPMQIRYFTLEEAASTPHRVSGAARAHPDLELRLGRIASSGDLSDELAVRTGDNELTYRDDQRWTEKPEQYLRRGLERALFQERGVTRAYSGPVPTLDVELIELAEIQGTQPKARVRAIAHLHDERRGLCDETFSVEQPIQTNSETEPGQAVAALSRALHRTVSDLADRVVQCLVKTASAGGESTAAVARP